MCMQLMAKSAWVLEKEESGSPSLGPTPKIDVDFPLPSSHPDDMADNVKKEDPPKQEDRLSPSLSSPSLVKLEPKVETEVLSSQSLIFNNGGIMPQKRRLSPTPTPPPLTASASGSTSMASTPPLDLPSIANNLRKIRGSPVQLIGDLPIARQDALASFNEIIENNYQYKTLGRSREALESMTCDCVYEYGQFFSSATPLFIVVGPSSLALLESYLVISLGQVLTTLTMHAGLDPTVSID